MDIPHNKDLPIHPGYSATFQEFLKLIMECNLLPK